MMELARCKECGGDTIHSNGEVVCTNCGLVLSESVTFDVDPPCNQKHSPAFSRVWDQTEIGSQPYFVGGLGAYIGFNRSFFFKDRRGKPLPAESQHLFAHLKAAYDGQNRFRGYETTYRCFCALNRVAEILKLPKMIRRRAAYLFRKAIANRRVAEGETSLVLIGYCILLAIREFDRTAPSRIKEIATAFQKIGHRVTSKSIVRVGSEYRDLLTPGQRPTRSEDYLGRILDRVVSDKRVLEELKRLSTKPFEYRRSITPVLAKLLGRINAAERGGRNPYVFAASTLYAAEVSLAKQTGRRQLFTQKTIAEIAEVAEYSIREHFCSILKRHSRDLQDYEQTVPSHSPESGPSEGDLNLHLKTALISRRRKETRRSWELDMTNENSPTSVNSTKFSEMETSKSEAPIRLAQT